MTNLNQNINKLRLEKKNHINSLNYMYDYKPFAHNEIKELNNSFNTLEGKNVSIIGRVVNQRNSRMFLVLREEGCDIQCYIPKDCIRYDDKKLIDNGDILFITGVLSKTNSGEITIFVSNFEFSAKCVVDIPDQYFLSDENKYGIEERTKYLTLNKDAFNLLKSRFITVSHVRDLFKKSNFIEVETPVLQRLAGGALAKPFKTFYSAEKVDFSLRIAPELYLKRLIISGYKKVFEIAKNFRNEGCSPVHNPEFSMLEAYARDWKLNEVILFVNSFIKDLCKTIMDDENILADKTVARSVLEKEFETVDFFEKLHELVGYKVDINSWDKTDELSKKFNIVITEESHMNAGDFYSDIVTKFYIKNQRKNDLINLINHPSCISPLSKNFGEVAKRFEVYIFGTEVVDGFEENNDFQIQWDTFESQKELINNEYDRNYIRDLMLGMPHTSGFGIGIDRLVSLLYGASNIREIISYLD